MKKLLIAIGFFAFVGVANANDNTPRSVDNTTEYTINDENVEALFTNSTDITFQSVALDANATSISNLSGNPSPAAAFKGGSSKSALVAILLDFFIGGLGIHRAYLGTKTFTWIGYILSCGGIFGLVPFVDLIVLAVNFGDISKYVDNTKFFMW